MSASEIRVAPDKKSLTIVWSDGQSASYDAQTLRRAGRSADAVRARLEGAPEVPDENVSIVEVNPVGSYAINIVFSDGYHRGIYPWAYLSELNQATH